MIQKRYLANSCKQLFLALGLIVLIVACGDKKPDLELQEAFKIHEEALKVRKQATDQLAQLTANTDSLFMATNKSKLDSIVRSIESWDEQLVEVPGFDESHDHSGHDHSGHDHSGHNHGEQPELTSKQHLEVQQHLFDEIKKISERVNQIKE